MRYFIFFLLPIICFNAFAQQTSSELYLDLKKLASLKRVLYLAAHPDDENTRALAWLSLGEEAETAYLSLTRGDGGQNLIGEELGANLGILRSQELLAARSIDNAKQFFSRAVDFGYSRSAEESFEKWEKEEIVSDVVGVIRKFKPDVIITRFPPDERAGHGHHTASALLAIEASKLAADKDFLPNQIKDLGTWNTTSVYWNTSYWWLKDIEVTAQNNDEYLVFDIGDYNPTIGKSYNEIGTLARSQHKCQGFGSLIERGAKEEYFQFLSGEKLKNSFFEKSTRTWSNLVSKELENEFNTLVQNFDFKDVRNNVKPLLSIYKKLQNIKDDYLREEKLSLCQTLIVNCLGLHIELHGEDFSFALNEDVKLNLEAINRSKSQVSVEEITINGTSFVPENKTLSFNQIVNNNISITANSNTFAPYWLQNPYENLFDVTNVSLIGNPTSKNSIEGIIKLNIEGVTFEYPINGIYKWSDPAFGEKKRDIVFTPNMAISIEETALISKIGTEKKIKIKVHSFQDNLKEKIHLKLPQNWEATPNVFEIDIQNKHNEKYIEVVLKPNSNAVNGSLILLNANQDSIKHFREISYDHIPTQTYFTDDQLKLVKIDSKIKQGKIAYIKGVEDKVPQAISQLGFDVKAIEVEDIKTASLNDFQTIVVGIRAYNVKPELDFFHQQLMDYVSQGGNLIVQYNTSSKSVKEMQLGPYPFDVSRGRVTEEDAKVSFVNQKHPILNFPNKIAEKDFENWVQERGLYFADNWDAKYETLLSWNDKGQESLEGALIVAKHGKGQFIYTGISFFRQLPAGVEGAYRLFANMLSYGGN